MASIPGGEMTVNHKLAAINSSRATGTNLLHLWVSDVTRDSGITNCHFSQFRGRVVFKENPFWEMWCALYIGTVITGMISL